MFTLLGIELKNGKVYESGGLRKLVKPISDKTPKFIRKGFLS
jgi:hypothetical protein